MEVKAIAGGPFPPHVNVLPQGPIAAAEQSRDNQTKPPEFTGASCRAKLSEAPTAGPPHAVLSTDPPAHLAFSRGPQVGL